jgi:hypothetical protein
MLEEEERDEEKENALSRSSGYPGLGNAVRYVPFVFVAFLVVFEHWLNGENVITPPGVSLLTYLQIGCVCLLAAFTFVIFVRRFSRAAEMHQWSYMVTFGSPEAPSQKGYSAAAVIIVAVVLILAFTYYPPSRRVIQVAACIAVLVATTRILYTIGSRQISKLLRYGYYATAILLAAEAVMVMVLGGTVDHG